MRDNFTPNIVRTLAQRVGQRCSNPNCRRSTSGPQMNSQKAINVGDAAHITAASSGGKRYDPKLSSEERSSIENGIWLCKKCAKLIDDDEQRYTVELLRKWKILSEEAALLAIESNQDNSLSSHLQDLELVRFYSSCLDRPAFQDSFHRREESLIAFDKALEDTITAINTGCLRSRDGIVLTNSKGKSHLSNHKWREKMDTIVSLLRVMRSRFKTLNFTQTYEVDHKTAEWMDNTRDQIIAIFSELCKEAGIPSLRSPKDRW